MFQSAPPVKGATRHSASLLARLEFQSAPPVKGATVTRRAMPAGELFQSAPPVKGATPDGLSVQKVEMFQSAPPVKGATERKNYIRDASNVSIRAPREGGDPVIPAHAKSFKGFNPRPP